MNETAPSFHIAILLLRFFSVWTGTQCCELSTRTSLLALYPLTPQSPDTPVNHDGNWPPAKKPTPNGPQSQASFPLLQVIPTYILAFSSTHPRHGNYPSDRMPHMGCQNTPPHNPSDQKFPPSRREEVSPLIA